MHAGAHFGQASRNRNQCSKWVPHSGYPMLICVRYTILGPINSGSSYTDCETHCTLVCLQWFDWSTLISFKLVEPDRIITDDDSIFFSFQRMEQMDLVQTVWSARWPPHPRAVIMHSRHIPPRVRCKHHSSRLLPPHSKFSTLFPWWPMETMVVGIIKWPARLAHHRVRPVRRIIKVALSSILPIIRSVDRNISAPSVATELLENTTEFTGKKFFIVLDYNFWM